MGVQQAGVGPMTGLRLELGGDVGLRMAILGNYGPGSS